MNNCAHFGNDTQLSPCAGINGCTEGNEGNDRNVGRICYRHGSGETFRNHAIVSELFQKFTGAEDTCVSTGYQSRSKHILRTHTCKYSSAEHNDGIHNNERPHSFSDGLEGAM